MSFPSGLVSEWMFNGSFNDSVGGYNLTGFNSPTFPTGKIGQGLGLATASSQYAAVAAYPPLRNVSKFSLEIWIHLLSALTDFQTLIGWQTAALTGHRVALAT